MSTSRNKISALMAKARDHDGRLSAVPLRVADSALANGDQSADELRGVISAIYAAADSGNTYRVFLLKTSPAPVALPSGSPPLPATIYVADIQDVGGSFAVDDTIRAIKKTGVDTYNSNSVDWELLPTGSSTPVRMVCVDRKSMSQGAGDWVTPKLEAHRYFSGTLGTTPTTAVEGGDIWILSNDHHDDLVDTDPDPDVDYPWLPVYAEFKALDAGEEWDPQEQQDSDQGSPPAWNSAESTYGTDEADIDRVKHNGFFWDAAVADVPTNSEPADANGNWTKGEAIEDSDPRPVYRVDPIPPGLVPGYTTTTFSAASGQTTASPTMTSGSFQTFVKDEGGAWTEGPLLTGVLWNQERSVSADTPAWVEKGIDGFWLTDGGSAESGLERVMLWETIDAATFDGTTITPGVSTGYTFSGYDVTGTDRAVINVFTVDIEVSADSGRIAFVDAVTGEIASVDCNEVSFTP